MTFVCITLHHNHPVFSREHYKNVHAALWFQLNIVFSRKNQTTWASHWTEKHRSKKKKLYGFRLFKKTTQVHKYSVKHTKAHSMISAVKKTQAHKSSVRDAE